MGEGAWATLPKIGQPGTAAPFQLQRLRDWGLSDLATVCTTREQAVLAHHCALYVRMVWQDRLGCTTEPPSEVVRHCVAALIERPGMLDRAETTMSLSLEHDDRPVDLDTDPELLARVTEALRAFA